jgi:hypothetical protein
MAITFDPTAKRIVLDSTTTSAPELWSRWADWVTVGDNAKYLPAFRQTGGDDLGSGLSIPPYLFLLNGWRVRPMEANQLLVITGNLFTDSGGAPVVATLGAYNVSVQYTVPVQAQGISTSGAAAPSAAQVADAVWQRAIESGLSAEQLLRIMLAPLAGKADGIGSPTERYMAQNGTTPRVTTTFDTAGNRTVVLVDGS